MPEPEGMREMASSVAGRGGATMQTKNADMRRRPTSATFGGRSRPVQGVNSVKPCFRMDAGPSPVPKGRFQKTRGSLERGAASRGV